MLRHRLTHPEIIEALAAAGHGSRVLVADANFPASTKAGENAMVVYLNLAPGKPSATDVLNILLTAVNVEDAAVMDPGDAQEPPIFQEFRELLPEVELTKLNRFEFYEEVEGPDTCLTIVTGEQRLYGNLLLTLGVVAG